MARSSVNDNCPAGELSPPRLTRCTTVALFGATAIVAQVLLLRECLVVVAGSELFIALFFGCWFLGIAVGAAAGSFLSIRRDRLPWAISLLLLLQAFLLPVSIIALRAVRTRWDLPVSQFIPFLELLRIAAVHLCPFSLLTGLTFPMLCRFLTDDRRGGERAIGSVYTIESLGSLIGGVVVTFVFSVYCLPLTGAWVLGLLIALNLTWFLLRTERKATWIMAVATSTAALAFLVALVSPARRAIEQSSAALRHRAYGAGFEWLAERYTPYQHLALVRRDDQYSLLGNGRFVESFPDPYTIGRRVHVMMSQCEKPRRILVIGGGEGGALRSLLLYPDVRIDYVEIDPEVLEMVRPYLGESQRLAFDNARVHIVHEDARHFVRRQLARREPQSAPPYDVVLCNVPDPSTAALNRFYTLDFFRQLRGLLSPSGIFVTSISSGVNYFDRDLLDYLGSVHHSLVRAFGNVLATPGTQAYLFATSGDDLLTSDVERLISRFRQRDIMDTGFSPLIFEMDFETEPLNLINRSLRASSRSVRGNTDAEPVTYLYHLRLWNRLAGGRSQRFLDLIERFDWRWVFGGCIVLFLARLFLSPWLPMVSDRAAYRQTILLLFLTGAAGMVASIVVLLLFQNFHGSLYRDVGLLVALFMAGLTLGGLWGNRVGRAEKASLLQYLALFALIFGLFFGVLESLVSGRFGGSFPGALLDRPVFFYLVMVAAGVLTGVQFPLAGRLAVICGRDPGRAGGAVECLDHLGACLGAFVTGLVLIPVSGLAPTLDVFKAIEIAIGLSLGLAAVLLYLKRKRGSG